MILQLIFTCGIMFTTIQTVIDLRERDRVEMRAFRDDTIVFDVKPEHLDRMECQIEPKEQRLLNFLHQTCPKSYDSMCRDPVFNKFHEFEYRCRFPIMTHSVLAMNSTSFQELIKMHDPYFRDWCMVVMFYSESCPFSARLAPHFNQVAGKFRNIMPVAVDVSDFGNDYRSTRLNFRYGISGTPTVLLWVNGVAVARMGYKELTYESIKGVITAHSDQVEIQNGHEIPEEIPKEFFAAGGELRVPEFMLDSGEDWLVNALYTLLCFFVCIITFIYHVRERILLSAPVLAWFQSKCGGPLCDDIYFLFYVAPPRHNRGAPPPPPAAAAAPEAPEAPAPEAPNDDVVELPPLIIEDQ